MKIVTVLKSGGDFDPSDVYVLKKQIEQNNDLEFYCLTDFDITDVNTISLKYNLPGWWSKLELFDSNHFAQNELMLYMDLDTLVVGNIEHLNQFKGNFGILRDAYRGKKQSIAYQSSVMLFYPGDFDYILNNFLENKNKIMEKFKKGGDQRYLETKLNNIKYLQDEFPEQLFSYKVDLCSDTGANGGKHFQGIPENARIIFFHGRPRPRDLNYLNTV